MTANSWTVILIDDNFDDMQVIKTMLEYHGIKVMATSRGSDCPALLEQVTPTLVITDLAMPESDGWKVLEIVRNHPATEHTPVVAVTAYHSPKLADDAIRGGFTACFPKPIDPMSFIEQLKVMVRE